MRFENIKKKNTISLFVTGEQQVYLLIVLVDEHIVIVQYLSNINYTDLIFLKRHFE